MTLLLLATACFDPLFEDVQTGDRVFCCRNVSGQLGTPYSCDRKGQLCVNEPSCSLPAFACFAPGTCSTVPCEPGVGGGAGGGVGGGGGGFNQDAGAASDAGQSTDAGTFPDAGPQEDAGALDAGPYDAGPYDAGMYDAGMYDAGAYDAGSDGGTTHDAGPPVDAGYASAYEFCCVSEQITTCGCPPSGCGQVHFTTCLRGTCVSSGACPTQ